MALVGADDGVPLPMSSLPRPIDDGGWFTDMAFSDYSAAGFRVSAPLSLELGDDTEMSPELATAFTVESNLAVDCLSAHDFLTKGLCPANNLSGAPFGLNVFDDRCPVVSGVVKVST